MKRQAREELMRVGRAFIESSGEIKPHELAFNTDLVSGDDLNECSMTIKNYD